MVYTHGSRSNKSPSLIVVDEFSKFIHIIPLDSKDAKHIKAALERVVIKDYERRGHKVHRIFCDH